MARPPNYEEMMDLVATLRGIDELVHPDGHGWRPEMHIEEKEGYLRLWFGPAPATIYHLEVTVEEEV